MPVCVCVLSGPNVTKGYLGQEQQTAEAYFTDKDGVRYFLTGDIGEWQEDGTLKIVDRKKDLIKLCVGFGTRVIRADGNEDNVENLVNGDQLIDHQGQPVYVVNFTSVHEDDAPVELVGTPLTAQLYAIQDSEAHIREHADKGCFFDTFYVTAEHRLTVGCSNLATVHSFKNGTVYATAWHTPDDVNTGKGKGGAPIQQVCGKRSIVWNPAGPAFRSGVDQLLPANCTTEEIAQERCDQWNQHFDLPRKARLYDITPVQWLALGPGNQRFASAVKINTPVQDSALIWMEKAINAGLEMARAHAPLGQSLPLPPDGLSELDARADALVAEMNRYGGIVPPRIEGAMVDVDNELKITPLRGSDYWSPSVRGIEGIPATPAGHSWDPEVLAFFPENHKARRDAAACRRFPGMTGSPKVAEGQPVPDHPAEEHEADFVMPTELTALEQRAAVKMWIIKLTAWVVGLWVSDGTAGTGSDIGQTEFDSHGSQRGIFQRIKRWLEALGYPTFYKPILGVPHQSAAGSVFSQPGTRIYAQAGTASKKSILRAILASLGLWTPCPPERRNSDGNMPAGWSFEIKRRFGEKAQRERLMQLPPELRQMLLCGLLDGDGWLQRDKERNTYGFATEHACVADTLCAIARFSGLKASSPIWSGGMWKVCDICAHWDDQIRILDLAVARDRIPLPQYPFRTRDPFSGSMKIIPPTEGSAPKRYASFQVSATRDGEPLALHQARFVLASGIITHNSHGEYIAVGNLEAKYSHAPVVDNMCVVGDSHHGAPVALVAVNHAKLKELAAGLGQSSSNIESLCANLHVIAAVLSQLNGIASSQKLEKWERLAAVKLYSVPWTAESGLLTEAMKLKRHEINKQFKEDIHQLYKGVA